MTQTYSLGRVVEHDERSRAFAAPQASELKTVSHRHYGAVLNQGQLGSCTGNALAQCLNTVPLRVKGRVLTEDDAVYLYSQATTLDDVAGQYPPTDTGSSGLAVCKAGVAKGWLTSYTHAFGLDQALAALVLQPVIVGTSWHQAMFTPDSQGFVHPDGAVAGGHEYLLLGINASSQYVIALNSWGKAWGQSGRFKLSFSDLGALLADSGDCTVPHA